MCHVQIASYMLGFSAANRPSCAIPHTTMPALDNIRVIELAGLAPGPFTGLLLAENGADVLRVDRVSQGAVPSPDVLVHGKRSICIDIKHPRGRDLLLRMVPHADVLIDPFRPGVLERLGLGPHEELLRCNPRLIVARLTGYRRDGKYAPMAGHDINYLAVSGVLSTLGPAPLPPSPPGNLLADFAGGGLVCFTGILLALQARVSSGRGQVVEANMVDGVSYLATAPRVSAKIPGQWDRPRGENLIDGGCPYYRVYECADAGRYVAVAGLEPKFFAALCRGLGGLTESDWGGHPRDDRAAWPSMHRLFADVFRSRTRAEWEAIFDGTDACCTPVLTYEEMEAARYEQRAMVTLSDTPSLAPDDGWKVQTLTPGDGGEQLLQAWAGWERDRDYVVAEGGLRTTDAEAAKL